MGVGSGFVNANLEETGGSLFQNGRIDIGPLNEQITLMDAASSVIVLALSNNHLLRIVSNANINDRQDIDLGRRQDDKIVGLFLDPTSSHTIICVFNARDRQYETLYLHSTSRKPVVLKRLKGSEITSVAWNPDAKREDKSTRELLLGTSNGLVFEAEIEKQEKYFKQVFSVDASRPEPISGLRIDRFKASQQPKYFIMVTTPRRAYQFIGHLESTEVPVFQSVLSPGQPNKRYLELPGDIKNSVLSFFAPFPSSPTSFAWSAGCGISFGELDFRSLGMYRARPTEQPVETVLVGEPQLWPYPKPANDSMPRATPLAIASTEFHIVLLYENRFDVLCLINQKIVMSEPLPVQHSSGMTGLAMDPVMEVMYAYSSRVIYKIEAMNETRDVWRLFLEKSMYDAALKYCSDNPVHKDQVLTAQAESLFKQGEHEKSANLFAKTQQSFEEVALRFMQADLSPALKKFLLSKLKTLPSRDKTQLTMVCTWLVEIYLNTLNKFKDEGLVDAYKTLQDEFREFLQDSRVQDNLDKPTAYDLIASHGNMEDLTFFASLIQDYERVIAHYVQSGQYTKALELLDQQPNLDLYYRFTPTLIQHVPNETVEFCMRRPELVPRQLIPAFIRYEQNSWDTDADTGHQAIRYFEWCISDYIKNKDPAIHNYLISLYVKLPDDTKLLAFFDKFGHEPVYDLKYALRLCARQNKTRACITIYSTMGLYEEAVDLALSVDLELAMKNADLTENEEIRKKLWLSIARHVVKDSKEKKEDIERAMAILSKAHGLLKIEDILPFFPDFKKIDHFKETICNSLKEYNVDIETLKRDMASATSSARSIRKDIQELRNKSTVIAANDSCGLCGLPLLSRPFYKFPCGHGFIADVLAVEVKKHLKPSARRQLERIEAKLKTSGKGPQYAELKAEYDEIIAADCIICGEMVIDLIDEPFIGADEQATFMQSWSIPGKSSD